MVLTSCGLQETFGSVPLTKYSFLVGQPSQVRVPVRVQIGTEIKLSGLAISFGWGYFSIIWLKILAQMGEAPVMPEATRDIGSLLLLPTQEATRKVSV